MVMRSPLVFLQYESIFYPLTNTRTIDKPIKIRSLVITKKKVLAMYFFAITVATACLI